jgi:hypothetical protein
MGWTKRQFVVQAFDEIGLASYVFDLTAEQLQTALRRLDAMMATWNAVGIRLAYPLPAYPQDGDLDEQTGVPDRANEAIYTNLAIKLAPSYGKQVSPDTKTAAKAAYNHLLSVAAMPDEVQMPSTLPRGAGQKPWRDADPFFPEPQNKIAVGGDGNLDYS